MNQTEKRTASSLTEQAYIALREKVISCELPPGADVKEAELAAMLEMSKTPVREAMGRLCLEGLMQAFPRRGYRVTPVTVKDMNNLFELRSILEGAAAGLAAKNTTEENLDQLEDLASAKYQIGEGESTKSFVASNHQFHIGIAKASNNPRLISLIERHLEEGTRFLYMGTRARDVNFETNSDHQGIIAALRTRDAQAATSLMQQHIENTRTGLLNALINQSDTQISF